jgi:D-alanyl-D-alanine endopeptidase (penicillin-binding protein 7)
MLVTSDNTAAELLARDYPGGRAAFIDTMNRRAQQLGMPHTRFVDASGLGAGNVGTAREVGVMIQAAAWYPVLGEISVQSRATVARRRHTVTLNNTNRELLQAFEHAVFGKTGFTTPAGRNVAMQLKYHGQDFVVVVMGASTRQQRYRMAHAMIQQHIQHIQRHTQEQLKK